MSSSGYGQGPKKETVYSGPGLASQQGTVYSGPSPRTGGGTVYNGPSAGGTAYGSAADKRAAQPQNIKAGNLFFLIAGLSALNTVLAITAAGFFMPLGLGITRAFTHTLRQGGAEGSALVMIAVIVGVFILIGVFARQGSSIAIVIGLLFYAGDTVLLLLDGMRADVFSVIVHGIFLVSIFRAYHATRS